jgi:hypothetical protein
MSRGGTPAGGTTMAMLGGNLSGRCYDSGHQACHSSTDAIVGELRFSGSAKNAS